MTPSDRTAHTLRIWDLPTRLFHWVLAASVIALVVTAKIGGNAMEWHLRLGYLVLALLVFRLVWGFVGGRWSRFGAFLYSPARLWRYVRGQARPHDGLGHSPLGALSVFALLAALLAQVGTGLLSDDEIAFAGPLTRFVSNATVGQATGYHTDVGQYVVIALVALHLLAIGYYVLVRREPLVGSMLHGHRTLDAAPAPDVQPARDDAASRLLALVVAGASAALAWWVASLGAAPAF